MKHAKQILDEFELPQLQEEDLLETIQCSKQILRTAPLQKMEPSTLKQMKLIFKYHFPKTFAIQIMLTILLFLMLLGNIHTAALYPSTTLKSIFHTISITLIIGSILFSMIVSTEILRNRFSDMYELERVCTIRMEKIIGFKLSILTIFTFLIFSIAAFLIPQKTPAMTGATVFVIGILPYLVITTFIVQFSNHMHSIHSIALVYIFFTLFFILCMLYFESIDYILFDQSHMMMLLVVIILCAYLNYRKLTKNES